MSLSCHVCLSLCVYAQVCGCVIVYLRIHMSSPLRGLLRQGTSVSQRLHVAACAGASVTSCLRASFLSSRYSLALSLLAFHVHPPRFGPCVDLALNSCGSGQYSGKMRTNQAVVYRCC